MKRLEDHTVYTHGGSVTADHIIIAVDKLEPHISPLSADGVPRADLPERHRATHRPDAASCFPSGEQMQCWDSKLVYTYFRLTPDNRLLLGGGSAFTTFLKDAYNNPGSSERVIADFLRHFPELAEPVVHPVLAGTDRHHA
jgi:gamma-glutamylputrescine oxidase